MGNAQTYTIESSSLKASVAAMGAELQSVVCAGVERMWCADPSVWPRHAPLLFPLIGRMRNGQCKLGGKLVSVPRHGFCRNRPFEAEQASSSCVRFRTRSDDETRQAYPFDFALEVEFSIEESTLAKTHRITNTGDAPMPFELGGHEAYALLLTPGERSADYYVQIGSGQLSRVEAYQMDAEGILQLPKVKIPLRNGCLRHTPEQLGLDTIVLEGLPERFATLACDKSDRAVTVDFPDFPYLGIWTKPVGAGSNARYLCIEPWSALPDAHFASGELAEKPGVRTLAPGECAALTYRMTFK